MKITKVLFFSFLLLLGAATVSAQVAERQTERLTIVLDLTPEQAEKVKAINLAFAEKTGERRDAQREAMQRANEARKAEMKAVLTEEQFAKLEALQAQRKDRKPRKGNRG